MTRYQELQAAIRESNKGVHYLKQDHETFHVESLCAEIDQLRARVADLENDLEKSKHEADDWHRAWETVTEQAKKEVAEWEADKARLDWLAREPYPRMSEVRSLMALTGYPTAEAKDLIRAAIDAARAGKGAT